MTNTSTTPYSIDGEAIISIKKQVGIAFKMEFFRSIPSTRKFLFFRILWVFRSFFSKFCFPPHFQQFKKNAKIFQVSDKNSELFLRSSPLSFLLNPKQISEVSNICLTIRVNQPTILFCCESINYVWRKVLSWLNFFWFQKSFSNCGFCV